MNLAYELLHKQAESNKQLYTLLRFASKCDNVTAFTMDSLEPIGAFLSAQCKTIRLYTVGNSSNIDLKVLDNCKDIASNLKINFKIDQMNEKIESTELLYINTPAEGNYRATELMKFASKVSKYIILPDTVAYAHKPNDKIKLADGISPIGVVFGINHFIQHNDNWFILEHDEISPGMTVLVNKDNVSC